MKTITRICLMLFFITSQAQTVTTVTDGAFVDGLGITSNGDIYCSDFNGSEVYKYEFSTGIVTTFATGFVNPNGIGVTNNDLIYICEKGGGTIHIYNTDGDVVNTVTGLNNPTGVKYKALDNTILWVSYDQSSLNVLNPDTLETEVLIQGPPLNGPSGITFIDDQTYISNFNDRKVFRLESDDTLTEIAQLPAGAAQNNFLGFISSKDGFIIATQFGEHRIYRIDPETGDVFLFAGSSGGVADGDLDTATFAFPNGILGDDINDRIYVADFATGNLRIIDNVSLSVDDFTNENTSIKLFSNLQNNSMTIEGTLINSKKYAVSVYDISGQLIQTKDGDIQNRNLQSTLNTSAWSKGVYIVKIKMGETIVSRKFIKQ